MIFRFCAAILSIVRFASSRKVTSRYQCMLSIQCPQNIPLRLHTPSPGSLSAPAHNSLFFLWFSLRLPSVFPWPEKGIRWLMKKFWLTWPVQKTNAYRRIEKELKTNNAADNLLQRKFECYGLRRYCLQTSPAFPITPHLPVHYTGCIHKTDTWVCSQLLTGSGFCAGDGHHSDPEAWDIPKPEDQSAKLHASIQEKSLDTYVL